MSNNGFYALHYTYIRLPTDPIPGILGSPVDLFEDHIQKLSQNYQILSPEEILHFYKTKEYENIGKKNGFAFTFDDGVANHFIAAKILHKHGIKALFFIPTCILTDGLPINPTIIHYCVAKYGVPAFLETFNEASRRLRIKVPRLEYKPDGDSLGPIMQEIKRATKYVIEPHDSRKLLLYVYDNTFHRDYKDAMEVMYLTRFQIKEMIAMGHSIGSHTHSHFSVGSANLSEAELKREVEASGKTLEKLFNVKVNAIAYPFGESKDCLSGDELSKITTNYELAFTLEERINRAEDSPLEIGRYVQYSKDTGDDICKKLKH